MYSSLPHLFLRNILSFFSLFYLSKHVTSFSVLINSKPKLPYEKRAYVWPDPLPLAEYCPLWLSPTRLSRLTVLFLAAHKPKTRPSE